MGLLGWIGPAVRAERLEKKGGYRLSALACRASARAST